MKFMRQLFLTIFALLSSGCGTGTGNPLQSNYGSSPPAHNGAISYVGRTLEVTCEKLTLCHINLTQQTCYSTLSSRTGLASVLGPSSYSTFQDLILAEATELLAIDSAKAQTCQGEILLLSCDSSEVQNAYDNNAEDTFGQILDLFPAVCNHVISSTTND